MYKLLISSKANREIRKISRLHKEAIINALYELKQNPLEGKPLTKELTGRLSYRVGFYRIIYTVNRNCAYRYRWPPRNNLQLTCWKFGAKRFNLLSNF